MLDLDFGKCSLKVQVPEKGAITSAKELIGKNVVTSFTGLTKQYFARLEKEVKDEQEGLENGYTKIKGVSQVDEVEQTKIKFVGGSVEAACALGVAHGIVDLVGRYFLPCQYY